MEYRAHFFPFEFGWYHTSCCEANVQEDPAATLTNVSQFNFLID